MENVNILLDQIKVYLGGFVGNVIADAILAVVALVVGLIVIGWVVKLTRKALAPAKIDPTLKPFLVSLTNISLKVILFISIYQNVGGEATSIVAILGAASLAIGLAFQGALSNFAGGILLLSLRPFHVGDFIEVGGEEGLVEAIHVFNTILVSRDNKVISIPNGTVAGATIVNHTEKDKRRVDFTFGVGYESNLRQVAKIIEGVAMAHPKVDKTPAPFIRLENQGASSLDFTVRLWCDTDAYWDVYFDIMEQVTDAFNKNGISIPFPQMDVHLDRD